MGIEINSNTSMKFSAYSKDGDFKEDYYEYSSEIDFDDIFGKVSVPDGWYKIKISIEKEEE